MKDRCQQLPSTLSVVTLWTPIMPLRCVVARLCEIQWPICSGIERSIDGEIEVRPAKNGQHRHHHHTTGTPVVVVDEPAPVIEAHVPTAAATTPKKQVVARNQRCERGAPKRSAA